MNSQQFKVQNLLYEQNQKLKDHFMQIFGINLGNDSFETSGNLHSRQYSAKKAMSTTTLGDQSKSPKKLRSLNQGSQQIETILSDIRDEASREGSNKKKKDSIESAVLSPTASECQQHQEMKMQQQYLQEVFENVKEKNRMLYKELGQPDSKHDMTFTVSSAHIQDYGLVTTDKSKIKILDRDREGILKRNHVIEHQIFNLYHSTINNTLQREKYQTNEHLHQLRTRIQNENAEMRFLRNQNGHMKKLLARYKTYVLNFETEWKNEYKNKATKRQTLTGYLR